MALQPSDLCAAVATPQRPSHRVAGFVVTGTVAGSALMTVPVVATVVIGRGPLRLIGAVAAAIIGRAIRRGVIRGVLAVAIRFVDVADGHVVRRARAIGPGLRMRGSAGEVGADRVVADAGDAAPDGCAGALSP